MLQVYFLTLTSSGSPKIEINADKQSKTSKQTNAYKLNLDIAGPNLSGT